MSKFKRLFGLRLKELRTNKKIKQEQLAEQINIAVRNLSKIETGKTFPSADTLEKISETLGVSAKDLFDFEHLKPSDNLLDEIISDLNENKDKIKDVFKIVKAITK